MKSIESFLTNLLPIINDYAIKLLSNPIFGIFVAVAAIFYSYYLSKRSKIAKGQIVYIPHSRILFDKKYLSDNKLSFQYDNKTLDIVCKTQLIVYNAGKKSIRNNDIANNDKLRLKIDSNLIIYDFNLTYSSTTANNVRISKLQNHEAEIEFDYLDCNDGFVIEIVHDSKEHHNDMFQHFTLHGTVIDSKPIIKHYFSDDYKVVGCAVPQISLLGALLISSLLSFLVNLLLISIHIRFDKTIFIIFAIISFLILYMKLNNLRDREYNKSKEFLKANYEANHIS